MKVLKPSIIIEKLNDISNVKHKALLTLSYHGALRLSEVLNIKLSDVNFHNNSIMIRNRHIFKDRRIHISNNLIEILNAYLVKRNPKQYLFEGSDISGRYSVTSVQKSYKRYINNNTSFLTLRRSKISELINNGHNLKEIQDFSGIRSPKELTRYFTLINNKS